MSCGIYKITNKENGHMYIGLSKNIERRFSDHKTKALNSKKQDDLDKVLYKAMRKYGVDNFTYEIIEECPEEQLKEREIYWIKYYNTYEDRNHYNETPGGDMPGEKSIHRGEEHGRAILTEEDVKFCRRCYAEGKRSRDIHNQYFYDKIDYDSFLKMWHGGTWKHVMPEVFKKNPHPGKYTNKDCEEIRRRFFEKKASYPFLSVRDFSKSEECYVGYGTLWKMLNTPEFYSNK